MAGNRADIKGYAAALLETAPDALALRVELTALANVISGRPRVKQVLLDASLESETRIQRRVDRAFPKASKISRRLLALLVAARQVDDLPQIARAYSELAAVKLKVIDVTIESAYPITVADQGRIARGLPLDGRQPLITSIVNQELIGGVRATVAGATYDASVAGRLNEITEEVTV